MRNLLLALFLSACGVNSVEVSENEVQQPNPMYILRSLVHEMERNYMKEYNTTLGNVHEILADQGKVEGFLVDDKIFSLHFHKFNGNVAVKVSVNDNVKVKKIPNGFEVIVFNEGGSCSHCLPEIWGCCQMESFGCSYAVKCPLVDCTPGVCRYHCDCAPVEDPEPIEP